MNYKNGLKYFVLLIITDGVITDMHETTEAIIECSFLPMSIIIIGVGNEDFSAMNTLDCDKGRLKIGHRVADRDIVQFVALREFINQQTRSINQAGLSKAVLYELPDQVTEWMRHNNIVPSSSKVHVLPPTFSDNSSISPNVNSWRPESLYNEDSPYPMKPILDNAQFPNKSPPYPKRSSVVDSTQSPIKSPPYPSRPNIVDSTQTPIKSPPYPIRPNFVDSTQTPIKSPPYPINKNLLDNAQSSNEAPPYPINKNSSDSSRSSNKPSPYPTK